MANTEFPSGGGYVFPWFAERLVSNILAIVEIVPGYYDFIALRFRYVCYLLLK
jgi:hypothetical protein